MIKMFMCVVPKVCVLTSFGAYQDIPQEKKSLSFVCPHPSKSTAKYHPSKRVEKTVGNVILTLIFFVNCSVKYLSEKKKIIIIFAVLRLFSGVQYYSALLTEIMITAPYFCIFTTSPSI